MTVLFDMDPGENGTGTRAVLPLEMVGRELIPQAHTLGTGHVRGTVVA
jgi:hypothetical protein